jgi:5-methyltetrahydrofolate--homocysteine methyltransferase
MTLSGGYAVMPEQSTVAIIAHHPQAVYFGMKSGFIPEGKSSDELIAGTERGGDLPPEDDPTTDDDDQDEAKAESAAEAVG